MRRAALVLAVTLTVTACAGSSNPSIDDIPELPEATTDSVEARLAGAAKPVVLNVWASWCIPCRSEAPLLDQASAELGDQVDFVMLNVRDSQSGARGFVAEFFPDADFEYGFDREGDIPIDLGGNRGVPLTFFYATGGELIRLHTGVIDERTLALEIDEIIAASAGG
jgi:cytochrome c biogenesis protein CcmG/thiol:disulfide interchange protein DsbE